MSPWFRPPCRWIMPRCQRVTLHRSTKDDKDLDVLASPWEHRHITRTTSLHLRHYQTDAIDSLVAAWSKGIRRPAVVLPTGGGKTVIFAHLTRRRSEEHTSELQ